MSYAGDVTPTEAYEALTTDENAVLVDVRTAAEWAYVGVPDIRETGKDLVTIEWVSFPDGAQNQAFLTQLRETVDTGATVYFLCRSGVRSVAAAEAATAAGWAQSYNILDGFEGAHGPDRHRDVSGWKVSGLPWFQG